MKGRLPVKRAVSAGGVVWRIGYNGEIEIVMCGRSGDGIWVLPKGTPDDGETLEETAEREVSEETGLTVRRTRKIGTIDYWFAADGVRYHKYVHHWLMEATGGGLSNHDHEFDEAVWRPIEAAKKTLTHDNEKRVLELAEALILEDR